ncbi:TetR/AcrR family transcriptional regulator C-terminal domain-containing protein [Leucobacter weissii]|uniref:TetR/AcrR family transcriptional regulator C-terminal domain-containing protein n=2 Tax=Leucobacter weissii TaxID=1983706 RepID=A0A939S5V1_9MICO|nr:TetR/AcrR family transcriptional regulator C-terminal domain-containing protein [Leucobacter weissii]
MSSANRVAATRGSGRPRQAVLDRELILRTALRLLDERGEQGAGIRDIARELGVRPSALYNHVAGQDDIIAGLRELVSDRIDVDGFGSLPWDAAVRLWARSYRRAFAAHPPTIALLAVRPLVPGSRTGRMYDAVCAGFLAAGWPEERVLTVVVALESFILGSALDQVAPDDMLDPGDGDDLQHFRAAYAARARGLAERRASDAAFETGLDALLAGLGAELAGAGPVGGAALSPDGGSAVGEA